MVTNDNRIRPVILCGGGGTRLWPLSTPQKPKQFLALASAKAMLVDTVDRLSDRTLFSKPIVIGSERHRLHLEMLLPGANLLLEPAARDSAPPLAAAALLSKPQELILALPSDHYIEDVQAFLTAVVESAPRARDGRIVTFGIEPSHPDTGYGYIKAGTGQGIRPAEWFVEKPSLVKAKQYLSSGSFYWNSGIFLFRADTMLEAFEAYAPVMLAAVKKSLEGKSFNRENFKNVPSGSIDYTIMEHHNRIDVAPVDMGWTDLGGFKALHSLEANRARTQVVKIGPVSIKGATRAYIRSDGPRVAVTDIDDIAVISTKQGVLVSRLSNAPNLKTCVREIEDYASKSITPCRRAKLGSWLWSTVIPHWGRCLFDKPTNGCVEELRLDGTPDPSVSRRGRVAARQLFTFARAKRLGWNKDGVADHVIENVLSHLDGSARAPNGGWVHCFNPDGRPSDYRRDFYDHTFVALAGAEVARCGDPRGEQLASEAFSIIDELFEDKDYGGWADKETGFAEKLANPHMHLLEASLNYFEASSDPESAKRIEKICILFERSMFDPVSGAVGEIFESDWSKSDKNFICPGHCYEWAFLLAEVERLIGRDTLSWSRRLIDFSERSGLQQGLVVDVFGERKSSYRLWPQLERMRALAALGYSDFDMSDLFDTIWELYLYPGAQYSWIDKLDDQLKPESKSIPASMLYHLMTGLAPFAGTVNTTDE